MILQFINLAVTLVRLIATAMLILFFWLATRKLQLVPGRVQSMGEMAVDFVRKGIAEESLGREIGRRYTPILVVIFFGVLFMNITGILPFLNIAGVLRHRHAAGVRAPLLRHLHRGGRQARAAGSSSRASSSRPGCRGPSTSS
ncbi:F0F1 ATP synthase subunit A [Georgenia sp. SUBG003]|uniref:F0F1 ATP synthase subunit A n=1 Tax=Georgenia sp. SUBG003 TaxID=1497974 RepID=UPI003AB79F3C